MLPEIFSIGNFTIHSYGLMILIGAIFGYRYMSKAGGKEFGMKEEQLTRMALIIAIGGFVGGKLFFYFENPAHYFGEGAWIDSIGSGFVFYGSLIFCVPATLWYFRQQKWPLWPLLDHLAITAVILHFFGRLGCLLAGCCHGMPTDLWWGIVFSDPGCSADPLDTPLHPTQIFSMILLSSIFLILRWWIKRKQFHGQVFLIYMVLYAIGRSVIEEFRGDEARGFVFDGFLSHSQLISLLIVLTAIGGLVYLRKRPDLKVSAKKQQTEK